MNVQPPHSESLQFELRRQVDAARLHAVVHDRRIRGDSGDDAELWPSVEHEKLLPVETFQQTNERIAIGILEPEYLHESGNHDAALRDTDAI